MKIIERLIHRMGRFVAAIGAAIALACAFVVITGDRVLEPAPIEVVHLDPIVVTISAERFDAIHAEARNDWMLMGAR